MKLNEMFGNVTYEVIENDRENPRTWPYFFVPAGWWYSHGKNGEAEYTSEGKSEYSYYDDLYMVDPNSKPYKGRCYTWIN